MSWLTWQLAAIVVALIADNAVLNVCRTFGKRERRVE